jgi:hypothetical protein
MVLKQKVRIAQIEKYFEFTSHNVYSSYLFCGAFTRAAELF